MQKRGPLRNSETLQVVSVEQEVECCYYIPLGHCPRERQEANVPEVESTLPHHLCLGIGLPPRISYEWVLHAQAAR